MTKNRIFLCLLAVLALCATGLTGCTDAAPTSTSGQLLLDDQGQLEPAPAASPAALATSRRDPRIDELQRTGVADYNAELGELDWSSAEVRPVNDSLDEAILVPIVHGGATTRFLAARIVTAPSGATFETLVLEFTLDDAGELASPVEVLYFNGRAQVESELVEADGEGEGRCWLRCMGGVGFACSNSCAFVPQCAATCVAAAAVACGIYCLWR
jgi:hypothetical protein